MRELRTQVLEANLEIVRSGLVISTFGNASGIDRDSGRVVIKPSGVDYDRLASDDLVVTDLEGVVVEGQLRPSSDLATHLELYKAFPEIGGVVHTHSRYATTWAQAGREIPCLGTTHADYFHGPVPLTEELTQEEIESAYEVNTGKVIARRFQGVDPQRFPSVLVKGHGPFSWGKDALDAAHTAELLEEIAHIAYTTCVLNPNAKPISQSLLDKHFLRKHGPKAYYGQ
ncbi:MAG: L-ribulose-5-phosphate 4-epimerase [Acidobacteriota bacterium]|nr:MAG: L-ribulose-5-phosphate 4-epimerase [Acidobacteriota bacterium]